VLGLCVGCTLDSQVVATLTAAGLLTPDVPAAPTPEPLVPTPLPQDVPPGAECATPSRSPQRTLQLWPEVPPRDRARFGLGVPGAAGPVTDYAIERLGIGWYLDWRVQPQPYRPAGIAFWQMVRVSEDGYRPGSAAVRAAALANPGATWLIGNEPDVRWQDNTTPERYAEHYYALYHLLKSVDPTCRVAIGGVSQPTPLRLTYLDRLLTAYRERYGGPMPVDVWNVHNFLLREQRDSWGVDIPPGMDAREGMLYEIDDHDDLDAFAAQVVAFRRWMAERGYREHPLVISEYGILMPADYGFGPDRVQAFLYATFDYLSTASDGELGYPPDGDRLVQWWAWYSLADTRYPTGNLFDPQTKAPTALGAAFAAYALPDSTTVH
jgi:hypothetical protein